MSWLGVAMFFVTIVVMVATRLPVYAVLQIVQGVLAYGGVGQRLYHGMPWVRHFAAAGMALALSGLLRLAEVFVRRGAGGIS